MSKAFCMNVPWVLLLLCLHDPFNDNSYVGKTDISPPRRWRLIMQDKEGNDRLRIKIETQRGRAEQDIKDRWQWYRARYRKRLKK